ncbi:GDYXXLXY domain-containing protein [Acidovorax sp. DW039]|uniref:GDYXXLXY domain-containing protein n=1 Tax=Acidovorax sp. DW039 TaxID=3095606 RepID=UPI003088C5EF|nr:GDYXXLXY domain-containing protein [Acidovorax sp. DW039]
MNETLLPTPPAATDGPRSPTDALGHMVHEAKAQGLLPPHAQPPADTGRPWPVVVLTALGAWLAALPILSIFGLFGARWIMEGSGAYLVGAALVAGAVALLRSKDLALFVEQLSIPALCVGGSLLGIGLGRDLPNEAAAGALAVITLGVAAATPLPWLRMVLGATAGTLFAWMLTTATGSLRHASMLPLWAVAHTGLAVWVGLLVSQHHAVGHSPIASRLAAALEPLAGGWLVQALVWLAMLSGMTFLAGGVLGGGINAAWHSTQPHGPGAGAERLWQVPQVGSALLVLAAAWVVHRAWPAARQAQAALLVVVLAGLGFFIPMLGGALLALAIAGTTQRWRLAGLAALAAAWIAGSFYYQLAWPLATKAMVLTGSGALLGLLAWFTLRAPGSRALQMAQPPGATGTMGVQGRRAAAVALLLGLGATLLVANVGIAQKERTIAQGRKVYVALAPVDPRSLMQGDFMRLNFNLPPEASSHQELAWGERPHAIGTLDERGVVQWRRVATAQEPLQPGELRFELTPRDGRWTLVTDAWYFREGDAARWGAAKFGEFRVEPSGKALLVGLADAQLQGIAP